FSFLLFLFSSIYQFQIFPSATDFDSSNYCNFRYTENEIPGKMQKSKGKELLHKMKEKVKLSSSVSSNETSEGKSKISKQVKHGYHCVKGKSHHPMEAYAFAQFKEVDSNELGLFAIFRRDIPDYLKSNLFDNIINQPNFWTDTESAIRKAYHETDAQILQKFGRGGSTAVTAILINCRRLVVANVGDSRAVVCRNGKAKQLTVDHEPVKEEDDIESRGGFVTRNPGDVPRVDGELAVSRAFGDRSIKEHLSMDPHIMSVVLDDDAEFAVLASDGIWHVISNPEAVDFIKNEKDAKSTLHFLDTAPMISL
ncbi:hypothetical protein V2J09_023706, partial [Rumex salicifolius]